MRIRTTLPPVWLAMAESAGGVSALGEALGYSRGTIWQWANGLRTPHPMVAMAVNEWARRRGLSEPFA
jgi:hypothetical protein